MPDQPPRHAALPVIPDTALTPAGPAMNAWLSQCAFVLDMVHQRSIDAYTATNWLTALITFADQADNRTQIISGT